MQLETVKSAAITPEQLAAAGTENGHQKALFAWAAMPENLARWPELRWLFAIPNGGLREPRTAALMKAMGAKRGVPDMMLPVRRGMWAGLFIELKVPAHDGKREGKASAEQEEWLAYLQSASYGTSVCVGWQAARNMIVAYLEWK